jgi:hypothetical protein
MSCRKCNCSTRAEARRGEFDPLIRCTMEQLDSGFYAQVPIELTGDQACTVQLPEERQNSGESGLWQLGQGECTWCSPCRPSDAGT